ncbi:hypothetical protein ABT373_11735 [Streptomyces sp. NPDC000070]|uniref:hypothetical protein n=1 Tax=Streptomyces sp. NPDC000070 TaxID=3154240 RepID=UPI00332E42D3
MTDLIHRLAAWAALFFRRPGTNPRHRPPTPTLLIAPPQHLTPPLPPHRSPYTSDDIPLDITAIRPVRPYLIAHEQHQRRRDLAMATLGQDMPGPYWIHGLEAA